MSLEATEYAVAASLSTLMRKTAFDHEKTAFDSPLLAAKLFCHIL